MSNEPDGFDYRDLSDDLRDFIEVAFVLIVFFAVFASVYAFGATTPCGPAQSELVPCPLDGGIQLIQPSTQATVVDVESAELTQPDGGIISVHGGGWLADEVLLTRANQIVATQAELDRLKATPAKPSTAALVITNVLTGLVQTVGAAMTACYVGTGNALCVKR